MSIPGFAGEASLNQGKHRYSGGNQFTPAKVGLVPQQARCPIGCHEANVACLGGLMFNTCWCQRGGGECPEGGWWIAGPCLGFWILGCIGRQPGV